MKMKVVIDNQTYEVEIEDVQARPVIALVEGERFEVWPEAGETGHEAASPVSSGAPEISIPESTPAAMPAAQSGSEKTVNAPLPGVIVALMAAPGDTVSRGQELCTLEAMKMKNAIRANRGGTIATVEVGVGDQVGHGQVLMTYSD
jgi:biotin carboxyl carrier protein